jgi:transglutaminase-like putative cysteine protease
MGLSVSGTIPVPFRLGYLPDGEAGVDATLDIMVGVVLAYRANPTVRYSAQRLVQNCTSRDRLCQVQSVQAYVRDKINYLEDVRDTETIQTPDYTLDLNSGDCDDQSVLVASLLESIGFQTRFCAMGVRGNFFSHVSSQVKLGRGWCNVETIVPVLKEPWHGYSAGTPTPIGWFPPDVTCVMLKRVP